MNIEEIIKEATEEANKRYTLINQRIGFILGVEWYANKSYNEEEVLDIIKKRDSHYINTHSLGGWKSPKDWFEQFKKK